MNRPTSISAKRYREEKEFLSGYIARAEDILRQPRKLILPVPSYGKTPKDQMPMLLAFERRQRINIAANWLFHVLSLGMFPHLTLSLLDTRHQRYALEKCAIARRRAWLERVDVIAEPAEQDPAVLPGHPDQVPGHR